MPVSIDSLIDRQLRRWEMERSHREQPDAAVPHHRTSGALITVSRQHGTHGVEIASRLADEFGYTLLHRDMIDRMCASTGYSRRLLAALDEHSRSQLTHWFDSMLSGAWVDTSDYARALVTTIGSIAMLGGVVVVGRGAHLMVGSERGFHVRVIAPRKQRIRQLMERSGQTARDAEREIDARDHERAEFIRRVYGGSIDNLLAYDLVINEAGRTPETIVPWLAPAAREKFSRLRSLESAIA